MSTSIDVERLAAVLKRPDARYMARMDTAYQAIQEQSIEAARHLAIFISRVRDLELDELQELYAETFEHGADVNTRLAHVFASHDDPAAMLDTLVAALPGLDADRNPFAYAVRSLCCVMLMSAVRA
jgi:hypothetical protein